MYYIEKCYNVRTVLYEVNVNLECFVAFLLCLLVMHGHTLMYVIKFLVHMPFWLPANSLSLSQ